MPYLIFIAVCGIWGASFILMKKASLVFGPVSIALWRAGGGAAFLLILAQAQRRNWRINSRDFWPLALVAIISYAWPYIIQPHLVAQHGSGFIGMTVSFTPLLTVLASVPLLGIYPSIRQMIGVIGGLACIALIMGDGLDRAIPLTDLLMAITVPLGYATGNCIIRRRLYSASPLAITTSGLTLTALLIAPLLFVVTGEELRSTSANDAMTLAISAAAILGVVGTGLATYLFNRLVQEQGPLFAGMVTYIIPLGALLWGWLDSEQVTARQLGALCGVLAMVGLVQFRAASAQSSHQPPEEIVKAGVG
jgi:drug/metabolite transporter (DMT)-like permease